MTDHSPPGGIRTALTSIINTPREVLKAVRLIPQAARAFPVALRERADELRTGVYTERATLLDQGYTPAEVNRIAYTSDFRLAWADLLDAMSRWPR